MNYFVAAGVFWIDLDSTDFGCWRLTLKLDLIRFQLLDWSFYWCHSQIQSVPDFWIGISNQT